VNYKFTPISTIRKDYTENGFAIIDNFLPVEEYKKMVKIYKGGKFEKVDIVREERYKLWETLEDKRFPSSDEIYEANFWSSNEVVNSEYYKNLFEERIRPLFLKLDADVGVFRHQATKVKNNGKNFIRCHYDDYMGYTGYILFLTELDWKYDWGGQLQISTKEGVSTVFPEPNRLILIKHSMRMAHWVNPVTRWAKEDRDNINGFCIKSSQELPDTWLGDRDDYAIY